MRSRRPTASGGEESNDRLAAHILPTSATMVGVCVTVIGLVRLIETSTAVSTFLDKILAGDSLLFLSAAFSSYLAMRAPRTRRRLETFADVVFMIALFVLAGVAVMVAWEMGTTPSR